MRRTEHPARFRRRIEETGRLQAVARASKKQEPLRDSKENLVNVCVRTQARPRRLIRPRPRQRPWIRGTLITNYK